MRRRKKGPVLLVVNDSERSEDVINVQ